MSIYQIAHVTGGISILSSILIIFVIGRSKDKLSTIYHRIMLGMSCADILGSFAMALTSLPMPNVINDSEVLQDKYGIFGPMIGTTFTCELQGFFFMFGTLTGFSLNGMLCVYYALAIAFRLKEKTIHRYFEPILIALPLCVGVGCTIATAVLDQFNPSPFEPWCFVAPFACGMELKKEMCDILPNGSCLETEKKCYRGDLDHMQKILATVKAIIAISCFAILLSLVACTLRVFWTNQRMIEASKIARSIHRNVQDFAKARHSHDTTKLILAQAFAYMCVFGLLVTFPFMREKSMKSGIPSSQALDISFLIVFPSQGFFNCIIFMSHKVYNFRRSNSDVSVMDALKKIVNGDSIEPFVMERISIIDVNYKLKEVNVEIEDESGRDERMVLSFATPESLATAPEDKRVFYDKVTTDTLQLKP